MRKLVYQGMSLALTALALAGCKTSGGVSTPPGFDAGTDISPTGSIKLGEVYRSAVPLSAQHQPELSEMCPRDYTDTKALAAIRTKYSSYAGTAKADDIRSASSEWGVGLTGIEFSSASIGGNYKPKTTVTATYKGVTYFAMEPDDVSIIRAKLGDNCKADIAGWRKKGYGVFIPTGAYKADDLTITTLVNNTADADISAKIGKVKPGFKLSRTNSSSVTVSGKKLYYKIVSPD